MKKVLLIVVLALLADGLWAQSFYNRRIDRRWIVSGGTGTAKYFGEITNDGDLFHGTMYNIEAGLTRRFTERLSARAILTFFQFQASDAKVGAEGRATRNLSFKSINFEASVVGEIQLFPEIGRYYQRPLVNPYLFVGVGALYYVPKAEAPAVGHDGNPLPEAGKMVNLRKLQTERVNYSPVTLAIPFGLGVKMMIAPAFNISLNGGFRYTLSDYLDDISTVYPGEAAFGGDQLALAMSDRTVELGLNPRPAGAIRGNPSKKDSYFLLSIRVEYYLPPNIFGSSGRRPGGYYKRRGYKRRTP